VDARHKAGHDDVGMLFMLSRFSVALLISFAFIAPASAAKCGGDFERFVAEFRREAAAKGIPARVLSEAFDDIEYDPKVMAFDRRQRNTFKRSWEDYARSRVTPARVKRAKSLLARHQKLFDRIEARFGVPRELVMAIWTMETDNGGDTGKLPVVKTLTTLAHDCRRTDLFQGELLAALQIIARGDLSKRDLLGAYAGEIGQTQFLPSSYIKYGVDFDGDGHVNLRRSVPDVLASTANLLAVNGWQKGQPFGEGTQNFQVMREWNRSEVYRKTLHYFAEQLR
jgi:lytic murein transglycosylase